jgi:hypothetical protein
MLHRDTYSRALLLSLQAADNMYALQESRQARTHTSNQGKHVTPGVPPGLLTLLSLPLRGDALAGDALAGDALIGDAACSAK